jgi:N6-adenosine-specific RNA methylase IME4/ParB-like chromosome segregation protein Spo0J
MELTMIPIADVRVGEGRRPTRNVSELADSIKEIGLLNPITITPDGVLVAGNNRLEACKSLGWEKIPALFMPAINDNAALEWQLAEIDENLIRNELGVLDRGEQLSKRKKIYEQLHPETKAGTAGAMAKHGSATEIISFAEDTAEKTGVTPRTVRQEVQIAEKILPEVKEVIRETTIADSKTDLLQLARMKPEEQKKVAEVLKCAPVDNVKQAVSAIRREERIEQIAQQTHDPTPLEQLEKRYPVIYADPPWLYDFSKDSADNIEEHYPTMELDDICDMPVSEIATRDCVLFLWATSPKLKEALRVIDSWGFTYRTCAVWDKEWIGPGYYFRQRHELLLVATRGNPPVPEPTNRPDSVYSEKRTDHSRKPAKFAEFIETMYPGMPKIELFCRSPREGWDCWGNEV